MNGPLQLCTWLRFRIPVTGYHLDQEGKTALHHPIIWSDRIRSAYCPQIVRSSHARQSPWYSAIVFSALMHFLPWQVATLLKSCVWSILSSSLPITRYMNCMWFCSANQSPVNLQWQYLHSPVVTKTCWVAWVQCLETTEWKSNLEG